MCCWADQRVTAVGPAASSVSVETVVASAASTSGRRALTSRCFRRLRSVRPKNRLRRHHHHRDHCGCGHHVLRGLHPHHLHRRRHHPTHHDLRLPRHHHHRRPPRPPPEPGSFGRASLTVRFRPSKSLPCISAIARRASSSLGISTNPKPRERPVSRSITIEAEATCPNDSNAWRRASSVVLNDKFPTYSFMVRSTYPPERGIRMKRCSRLGQSSRAAVAGRLRTRPQDRSREPPEYRKRLGVQISPRLGHFHL